MKAGSNAGGNLLSGASQFSESNFLELASHLHLCPGGLLVGKVGIKVPFQERSRPDDLVDE